MKTKENGPKTTGKDTMPIKQTTSTQKKPKKTARKMRRGVTEVQLELF